MKRPSYKDQLRKAHEVRECETSYMEHHKPRPEAAMAFKRKPYQTVNVVEYLKKVRGDAVG